MKEKGKENKQVEGAQTEEDQVEETAEGASQPHKKDYKPGAKKTIQFRKGRRVKGIAEPGEVVTLAAQDADHYIDTGYAFEVVPTKNKEV